MKKKNKKIKKKPISQNPISSPVGNMIQPTGSNEFNSSQNLQIEQNDPIRVINDKYAYVQKDVRRVSVYIGLIALLLVGFYFLNSKTAILNSFGNWIYNITNIQTG